MADGRGRECAVTAVLTGAVLGAGAAAGASRLPAAVLARRAGGRNVPHACVGRISDAAADGDLLPALYAARGRGLSAARGVRARPLLRPRRGARAAEPDDVHGSRLQRLRRDGLPHHRLTARAAHRDADEQPCAVQRALSAAHHAFDRVPFRWSHARCERRTARVAGALRVRDAARLTPAVRHAAAGRKLRLLPRAAALPPSARGAGAGALASGSDGIRPRPRGDGRRACGPSHLSDGELHRGRYHAACTRRGGARSAGARTGAGRHDPARLSARLSGE